MALVAQDTTSLGVELFGAVSALSSRILSYAIALAAVGSLSMALIEAWKKVSDSRTKFHAQRWTALMMPNTAEAGSRRVSQLSPEIRKEAYRQLLQLCSGGTDAEVRNALDQLVNDGGVPTWHAFAHAPGFALFAQETTVMVAMIQDAVDVSLAAPKLYRQLFDFMTEGADANDVSAWLGRDANPQPSANDARELANAYGRLRQIAKRKLDGFQVYTLQRWASGNQLAANVVGMLLMAVTLATLAPASGELQSTVGIVKLLVLCLGGGLLAPVAKDLVSALKKVAE